MSQDQNEKGYPRHFRAPPRKHSQKVEDARVKPLPYLIKSLLPGAFGKNILPPRLELGCWIENQHMLKIAEKLNLPVTEHDRQDPSVHPKRLVLNEINDTLDNIQMSIALVFTGGESEEKTHIYSIGSNRDLKNFPRKKARDKLLDILELKESDLLWWVSAEELDWQWTRIDPKMELLIQAVADRILAREWEGVLQRGAERTRRRKEREEQQLKLQAQASDSSGSSTLEDSKVTQK